MDATGGSYFPFPDEIHETQEHNVKHATLTTYERGPSVLDEFAKAALAGFCANPNCLPTKQAHFDALAEDAYRAGRAMLKERLK